MTDLSRVMYNDYNVRTLEHFCNIIDVFFYGASCFSEVFKMNNINSLFERDESLFTSLVKQVKKVFYKSLLWL